MAAVDLREKAKAKFAEAVAFAKEHGLEDAADTSKVSAADKQAFDLIIEDAKKLDVEYADAAKLEGNIETMGERFDFYSKAITGKGMGLHVIHQDEARVSLGRQFVDSDEYKALIESGALNSEGRAFSMDPVTQKFAASDIVSTVTGENAAGLVTPQFLPGVLPLPQRPMTVRELFSQGTATGDSISYAAQVAFDNAAAPVSQATKDGNPSGAKPQSSISWARRTAAVETLATWMAVTRQTLADAGQVSSIIDNQLRLMIQLVEEDQLLSGNGTAPNLSGLTDIAGVQTLDLTGEDALDGVRGAKTMVKTGLSRLTADAIVLNPQDSESFDLLKDLEGRYRGGDPFGAFPDANPIWRLRRVESEGVDQGTAIVGAFKAGATVLERMPITVFSTDSHSDFFIKNLIVLLAEERIGFPVFFPSAFVVITLPAGGFASGDQGVQT